MLGLEMFEAMRKDKKINDQAITTPVAYPSGFLPLDYVNGHLVDVFDENDNLTESYVSCGFVEGTFNTIISDSGLGKSTFVEQVVTCIAQRFPQSFIIHEDIEQSAMMDRIYQVSGMSSKWLKTHYRIYQDAHGEKFASRIIDHARIKLNNRKEFEYDTGLKDIYGDEIINLIPTCVILDSLAFMTSEKLSISTDSTKDKSASIDDNTNNMAGARNAKFNSEIFKTIIPYLKKANILLFVINHINRDVKTGFISTPRDITGLAEGEKMPGGRFVIYAANNLLRFKNKQSLKNDKDYGINGHIIKAEFYKSRTNASLQEVYLIFDKNKGFSKLLTMLEYAINNGLVKGTGHYSIPIDAVKDITFTKKTFLKTVKEHIELIPALYDIVEQDARKYISSSEFDDYETDAEKQKNYIEILNKLSSK